MSLYLLFLLLSALLGCPAEDLTAVVVLSLLWRQDGREPVLTLSESAQLSAVHPAQKFFGTH